MANTTPKRFQFTRRIHDNIARQFARKDVFLAVVEILQAIDFHLSGSDAVEGMKTIRQYVTVLSDHMGPPKAIVNHLLPPVRPKIGRSKAPTRGLTHMELAAANKGKRLCGFCLASNHREGSNCPKLQALKMNLKLTSETMTLVGVHCPSPYP